MIPDLAVRALGRAHGVLTSYVDVEGVRREASVDVIARVLEALQVIDGIADAPDALRRHRARDRSPDLPAVLVAWDGRAELPVPAAATRDVSRVDVVLQREDGGEMQWRIPVGVPPAGAGRAVVPVTVPEPIPPGAHRIHVHVGPVQASAFLISAPSRTYGRGRAGRGWGVMAPTYALRGDAPDLGTGHLGHLRALGEWLGGRGGSYLATLPLLPVFLDRPFDPSPYAPVSRRHWNEALIDPGDLPGERAPTAADPGAGDRLVDWREVGRRVDTRLDAAVAAMSDRTADALSAFVRANPDVERYARFRAEVARTGAPPASREPDPDPRLVARYTYAQWRLREQMADLARAIDDRGVGLVLDYPVGIHGAGYDRWEAPDEFAVGVSVGAPPDDFFPGGQTWGFPPTRPDAGTADGYARQLAAFAHHMEHAAALRIDHMMGLHRQFWVPDGVPATEGVYVRYPAEALWAVVSLASHRASCRVIGEDLGTVPAAARRALARHDALGLWVGQFRLSAEHPRPRPPRRCVASLSTHDTPTFAGWWDDADLRTGTELGYFTPEQAAEIGTERDGVRARLVTETGRPDPEVIDVMAMLLQDLGRSRAEIVVVGLDDCWGETEPTNVPGTGDEMPNWRRRHAHTLAEVAQVPALTRPLEGLARARCGVGS